MSIATQRVTWCERALSCNVDNRQFLPSSHVAPRHSCLVTGHSVNVLWSKGLRAEAFIVPARGRFRGEAAGGNGPARGRSVNPERFEKNPSRECAKMAHL